MESLSDLVRAKKFNEAENLLKQQTDCQESAIHLARIYHQIQFNDEEEYQQFMYILSLTLTPEIEQTIYVEVLSDILYRIIGSNSLKYALVVLRSFLYKIQGKKFSQFFILSYTHLFMPLFFDPTFDDLKSFFQEFKKAKTEVISHYSEENKTIVDRLKNRYSKSIQACFHKIQASQYFINSKKMPQVLNFCGFMLKEMSQVTQTSQTEIDCLVVALSLLNKFQVQIEIHILPLPYTVALLRDSLFTYSYTAKSEAKVLLKTLCYQLKDDLNSVPQTSIFFDPYIIQFIERLISYFENSSEEEINIFVQENYPQIEEIVEKINIFLGSIDPRQKEYQVIMKKFIPLGFLSPLSRQKLLRKLIAKHSNLNFKSHLISQYRKLITYKASKAIWIRSMDLLFTELKSIQPNTNIDYIGHILSFAYYWKGVTSKFLKEPSFRLKIHFDIELKLQDLNEKLATLKKGLETRLHVNQVDKTKESECSELSVCIFRLQELIKPKLPFQSSQGQ